MRHTTLRSRRPTLVVTSVAAVTVLGLAGCGGGGDDAEPVAEPGVAAEASARPDSGLVTPAQAAELATSGVTVIDVRTPDEYAEGHLEGARLIDLSSDTFTDEVADLDPDAEYLVYCRSGNRSAQAVAIMRDLGIEQVWDLDGGVVAYTAAGYALAT